MILSLVSKLGWMPSGSSKHSGEWLAKFGLELNMEKTRLIEFGRFTARDRRRRGAGKPEAHILRPFTHFWGSAGMVLYRLRDYREKADGTPLSDA
jgi:hypothetical protein